MTYTYCGIAIEISRLQLYYSDTVIVAIKVMSLQILFLWYPCPIWLFSGPFRYGYPTAAMTHWVCTSRLWVYISLVSSLLLLITICVLFHHANYDYCWDVSYSFCTTDSGFLKLGNFGSAIAHLLRCFCPGHLLEYWIEYFTTGLLM